MCDCVNERKEIVKEKYPDKKINFPIDASFVVKDNTTMLIVYLLNVSAGRKGHAFPIKFCPFCGENIYPDALSEKNTVK